MVQWYMHITRNAGQLDNLTFPSTYAETAPEEHEHQRAGLVCYFYAVCFSHDHVPVRSVLFVQHLFDRFGRDLSDNIDC